MTKFIVTFLWLAEIAAFTAIGAGTASLLAHLAALLSNNTTGNNQLIQMTINAGLIIGLSLGWLNAMKRKA